MIRWRYCLVLAMLLLLPTRIGSKSDDDDEEERGDEGDEDDDDDGDDDDEEQAAEKPEQIAGRRAPSLVPPTPKSAAATRTIAKRLLECYVCAYKSETPLRSCLDPSKYRVHTMTCHSADDKCFMTVLSKGSSYEAVVRGCRSGCIGNSETTCCELSRCNNQALSMPVIAPRSLKTPQVSSIESKSSKIIQPTILFFVTILLVLQTVVKVTLV